MLATADDHPRAVAYVSRIPGRTLAAIRRNPFYAGLLSAQGAPRDLAEQLTGITSYPGLLAAARQALRRDDIGWVVVWQQSPHIRHYLQRTGFRLDCGADGALVYRPQRQARATHSQHIGSTSHPPRWGLLATRRPLNSGAR